MGVWKGHAISNSLHSAGNTELVSDLYKRYGGVIYSRCLRILGDGAAAEDAAQETFIRVFRHIQKAPSDNQALAWIFRIATNYCLNQLRNQSRRKEVSSDQADNHCMPPQSGERSLEKALSDRDLARRVIVRAGKKRRDIAWLHFVDGLSQEEVAEVLGISRRTVGSQIQRFSADARKFIERSGQ
ncbi:MAG: sigma-70 family RNA polymerase sigma factor [Kofleriaceae bacterium]|nr:sigma-70 family RNA polymerase sigma factor [Kofleriaceae bacterium]